MRAWRTTAAAGLAVMAATAVLVTAPAHARSADGGQLYVLHGLPGVVADVEVDGAITQEAVTQGAVLGPIELTAGSHEVTFVVAGGAPVTGTVDVVEGASVDVVAHLPAAVGGDPVLTAFPNDVSAVGPGKARLAVAHTAQVPPADIRVDGEPLLSNVANAEVLTVEVPEQTYSVDIVPTGTEGPAVFGPVDLAVEAGTLTRVFAFGSPATGTMDVLVHELPVTQQGAVAPAMVQTGDGGQVAALLASRR